MANNIIVFSDPEGRYYNIVVDGRIVDGLGPDEALAVVAVALLGGTKPAYAKGRTMDEWRDEIREQTERRTLRKEASGARERLLRALVDSGFIDQRGERLQDPVDGRDVGESFEELVRRFAPEGAMP